MEEEKFCPFENHPESDGLCTEERCGLWDHGDACCILVTIGVTLTNLAEVLTAVADVDTEALRVMALRR